MNKKILFLLLFGLFLTSCAPAVDQTQQAAPSPTVEAVEAITQPTAAPTSIPTETAIAIPTSDFSQIGLPAEAQGELVFDFVEQMCDAEWYTRGVDLPCPGDTQSSAGYVMKLDAAEQGLSSDMNILLAYTPQENYETIFSKYPAFTV
jgi:hypothetical protein